MVENYHTSYLRKDLTAYNTHFSWWVKISIESWQDRPQQHSGCHVLSLCWDNPCLLSKGCSSLPCKDSETEPVYINGSNRYKIHDNICIVGALNLILLSILVYLVQTFHLVQCWWPKVYIGIASRRPDMGGWLDTEDHILCNVYMKNVKFRTLSIHQYYCQKNLASGTYCLIFDWSHWLSFHCQITSFEILHVAWQALYITTLQGNASFNAYFFFSIGFFF